MIYLDNQHRILKYLCKLKYGVTEAHKKCLKPTGNDYNDITNNSIKDCTDAVVDMDKLRVLFVSRETMDDKEYSEALHGLVAGGYLTGEYFVTSKGKIENKKIYKEKYEDPKFIKSVDGTDIDIKALLFND